MARPSVIHVVPAGRRFRYRCDVCVTSALGLTFTAKWDTIGEAMDDGRRHSRTTHHHRMLMARHVRGLEA